MQKLYFSVLFVCACTVFVQSEWDFFVSLAYFIVITHSVKNKIVSYKACRGVPQQLMLASTSTRISYQEHNITTSSKLFGQTISTDYLKVTGQVFCIIKIITIFENTYNKQLIITLTVRDYQQSIVVHKEQHYLCRPTGADFYSTFLFNVFHYVMRIYKPTKIPKVVFYDSERNCLHL